MSGGYYLEFEESDKIRLPSNKERELKLKGKSPQKKPKTKFKWTLIITLIILLYLFYVPILNFILSILQLNPTIYSYYVFIQTQIVNLTLTGLFFFSILSSVFFLILPSEATFIFYLSSTTHPVSAIVIMMLLGNLVGMAFNYGFGRLAGERVVRWMFKKNFTKYKEGIDKYGGYLLLFGNIFPGPIEALAVFYGGFKFNFSRYLYLVFIGRLIKYLLIFLAYLYFWQEIVFIYDSLMETFGAVITLYR